MPSFKIIGLLVREKKILKVFTIYGHDGHLGHVTLTIYINFLSPFLRRLHIKLALIGQAVSEEKMFGNNGYVHVYSPGVRVVNPWGQMFFINSIIQSIYSFAARFSPLHKLSFQLPKEDSYELWH